MCPDMFAFRFAHVTGLDSAIRPRNCEREIALRASPCNWAVLLGPPQPLGMQAPHSFETSATLTQRHSVTSHSHKLWQHVAPYFRTVASLYLYQPQTVFRQSPQTVTRTPRRVIHTQVTRVSWSLLHYKMSHYLLLLSTDSYLPSTQMEETVH